MTAQARVVDEPWADGVAIYLMRDLPGPGGTRTIDRPGHANGPDARDVITPGADPGPSLRLDDDMAMQLLDALARHYRRATDTGTLRQDYEYERTRVDRLTDALIRVTVTPRFATGGPVGPFREGQIVTAADMNRLVADR